MSIRLFDQFWSIDYRIFSTGADGKTKLALVLSAIGRSVLDTGNALKASVPPVEIHSLIVIE